MRDDNLNGPTRYSGREKFSGEKPPPILDDAIPIRSAPPSQKASLVRASGTSWPQMKPLPPDDPAELVRRLREQLILSQVRIMELEDVRDELTPSLAETAALLQGAQTLADQKVEALTHLEKVHADLQAQFQHMRHMQHVTNEALKDTRRQLTDTAARLQQTESQGRELEAQNRYLQQELNSGEARATQLGESLQRLDGRRRQLERDLGEITTTATVRLQRIEQLDAEMRAMKASRSWRWSKPIRAIERWLARRRSS
jgi:chromosome segregation ATPase